MEEGVPIPGLILPELRGIDEEEILHGQQIGGPQFPRRKPQIPLVIRGKDGGGVFGPEIPAEFVPEVGGGVPAGKHGGGALA